MTESEAALTRQILLALSAAGCLVWRQNVGVGWAGEVQYRGSGRLELLDPRPVRAGLCVGSSDIIGVAPGGKFLAIEVKSRRGRVTAAQQRFIDAVLRQGGIAGVVRSVDEALALVAGWAKLREEWLSKEMRNGGSIEHLAPRREELLYIIKHMVSNADVTGLAPAKEVNHE